MPVERLQVTLAQHARLAENGVVALQAVEADVAVEGEIQLVGVHEVHDQHFVAGETQMVEAVQDAFRFVQQVADHHDHAAPGDAFRKVVHDLANVRFLERLGVFQFAADAVNLRQRLLGLQVGLQALVENPDAHAVRLVDDQVRERGGGVVGVFQLVERSAGRAVQHGLAGIVQDVGDEVRFHLVLLDVVAVGLGEDFPVQVARVVAHGVFAVLRELDRKTVVWGAVPAGHEAFHHRLGGDFELVNPVEDARINVARQHRFFLRGM